MNKDSTLIPALMILAACLATRTTAADWQIRYNENPGQLWGLAKNGTHLLAVGDGALLTSDDGLTWSSHPTDASISWRSAAWMGTHWHVVGMYGNYTVSADGNAWSSGKVLGAWNISQVAWTGKALIGVGGPGTLATLTGDTDWVSRMPSAISPAVWPYGVAWNGSQAVVVGAGGGGAGALILTSPDGITWTDHSPATPVPLYGVVWADSQWIAVGSGGTFTSPDGAAWTQHALPASTLLNSVIWTGGQAIATGLAGDIYRSKDGVVWSGAENPVPTGGVKALAAEGPLLVAAGVSGRKQAVLTEEAAGGIVWVTRERRATGTAGPRWDALGRQQPSKPSAGSTSLPDKSQRRRGPELSGQEPGQPGRMDGPAR
jgi:hypothetical protein